MKHHLAFALSVLLCAPAAADVLSLVDGRWRGTGTGHGFDGENRDVRCRLDVVTTQTGRVDLRGSCAGPEGSQSFRLFVRAPAGGTQIEGGRLTVTGDEVGPFFNGETTADGLTLRGTHGGSVISITLRREGDLLHMISVRERGRSTERSDVIYQRS